MGKSWSQVGCQVFPAFPKRKPRKADKSQQKLEHIQDKLKATNPDSPFGGFPAFL
jgi:hypothetical protein